MRGGLSGGAGGAGAKPPNVMEGANMRAFSVKGQEEPQVFLSTKCQSLNWVIWTFQYNEPPSRATRSSSRVHGLDRKSVV